ncbi:hypothetical protein WN944_007004 [Citrus x changshan-huyou]|uniref:Uncharacterized protein n=1 Tax=Citrus x changshan-huyou TaxID=2935761 RepID=A0AAP0MQ07_9ROSI
MLFVYSTYMMVSNDVWTVSGHLRDSLFEEDMLSAGEIYSKVSKKGASSSTQKDVGLTRGSSRGCSGSDA